MKVKRIALACAMALAFAVVSSAQSQDAPVLKTRPNTKSFPTAPPEQDYSQPSDTVHGLQGSSSSTQTRDASSNAVPQGTRFLIRLLEPLDTRNLEAGQHFRAELREDLTTAGGLVISHGRPIHAHVAMFERGYTGARMMLAMDEMETSGGWIPLIATVTGVPGDPSIKSTNNEGEITQKGPDKTRILVNAAIGAAVGAASGAAAGGPKGAAAGAVAGAGVGTTTSFLMKGSDLKLDQGTNIELRLDRDLVVPTN